MCECICVVLFSLLPATGVRRVGVSVMRPSRISISQRAGAHIQKCLVLYINFKYRAARSAHPCQCSYFSRRLCCSRPGSCQCLCGCLILNACTCSMARRTLLRVLLAAFELLHYS